MVAPGHPGCYHGRRLRSQHVALSLSRSSAVEPAGSAGAFLPRARHQTVSGCTNPTHFLRHDTASMKRIGGRGPDRRSASGQLRMTPSRRCPPTCADTAAAPACPRGYRRALPVSLSSLPLRCSTEESRLRRKRETLPVRYPSDQARRRPSRDPTANRPARPPGLAILSGGHEARSGRRAIHTSRAPRDPAGWRTSRDTTRAQACATGTGTRPGE